MQKMKKGHYNLLLNKILSKIRRLKCLISISLIVAHAVIDLNTIHYKIPKVSHSDIDMKIYTCNITNCCILSPD